MIKHPALAEGAAHNGDGALIHIYLEKRAALLRFFTARTGSAAEAEDLVQEIFVKLSVMDDPEVTNGLAFLYRLGGNLMLDRYRSRIRSARRDAEYWGASHPGPRHTEPPPAEAAIEARQRLERVIAALNKLPPQCGRVFTLHKLKGLTYSETARTLGISVSAVEKHISRALKQLVAVV
jgi:RNA polymerase sigma factor (sigma-70 family)